MPRRSNSYRVPCEWLATGSWPDGTFEAETPDAVAHAVAIARALREALGDRNKSDLAGRAGIERSTLYDILAGKSWPDTVTLANLERELSTSLWPETPTPELPRSATSD
jgi:hypothetical protein